MQMGNPSMVLIGLSNGNFQGWSLQSNTLDALPAHQGPNSGITMLKKFDNIVISGDRAGRV